MITTNRYSIHIIYDYPKIQLSRSVTVTDEFRDKYNRWLLGFFGYSNELKDGEICHIPLSNMICVNPRTFRSLGGIW